MQKRFYLSFRFKLLLLLLTLSVIPLIIVAFIVSATVQNSSMDTLARSFVASVEYREKIVEHHLESNKSWIKSIAAQDILLAEMERYFEEKQFAANKVFASLVSLQRENYFIEKIYISDTNGTIISSTTSDNEGEKLEEGITLTDIGKQPIFTSLRTTPQNKRIITLITPFLKRSNSEIIGYLVVEYNASVIKSLIEGSLYKSNSINEGQITTLGKTYIIDNEGYLLTDIKGTELIKSVSSPQLSQCLPSDVPQTGIGRNENGLEVFRAFSCKTVDGITLTYVVEEETEQALATSRNVRNTIFIITLSIAVFLSLSTIIISRSITEPLKKLTTGVKEISKGNFNVTFDITTRDEIEEVAKSFNEMSNKIGSYVNDLKNKEDTLQEINKEIAVEKETISAERNKLEVIAAAITDAIIAVDLNRIVLSCNRPAEEMLGLAKEAIIGKEINELFELEDEEGSVDVSTYCPIRTDDFEGVVYNKDGVTIKPVSAKPINIHLLTSKIKEGVNVNLGCILTLHDKSKEAQLEDMKLDFVSMAAHELRTPITSIRGYASVLDEEMSENQDEKTTEWKRMLQRISVSSEQLLALVENLLNITKIEKGILSISCQQENWKNCVEEVVNVFKERAESKRISLTVKDIDETLVAYVDKLRINEVLTNLISNALTYTPEGGSITVETRITEDGSWIQTSVADTGKGIPKEAQKHLFEKFFRVTAPLEQGSKGNGLGLYISKSIVEMHGGKIWVESDEGKGAKFSYTIALFKK